MHAYIYICMHIYIYAYIYIYRIYIYTYIQTERQTDRRTYILIVTRNAKHEKTFKTMRQTELLFHIAKYQY